MDERKNYNSNMKGQSSLFLERKGYSTQKNYNSNMKGQSSLFLERKGYSTQKNYNSNMKGQFGVMEHLLMAVLLLMVIVAGLFFFFSFQATKSRGLALQDDIHKILLTSNILARSASLTKEELIFDDSKLVGFSGAYEKEGCEQAKKLAGNACVTIEKVLIAEDKKDCDPTAFTDAGKDECNSWTLCKEICVGIEKTGKSKGLSIPVNIYRALEKRVDLGVMTVRIPS